MEIPSDNAIDFAVQWLSLMVREWKANPFANQIDRPECKVFSPPEDADPKQYLKTVSDDLNAAFDLLADIFAVPWEVKREIGRIADGFEDEIFDEGKRTPTEDELEHSERLREVQNYAQTITKVEVQADAGALMVAQRLIWCVDKCRAAVMRGLLDLALTKQDAKQCESNISAMLNQVLKQIKELDNHQQANHARTMDSLKPMGNGIDFVVADVNRRRANSSKRGKDSQAKANTEERRRAAADKDTALKRVRTRVLRGSSVIQACREVCSTFKPHTGKRNALGRPEQCDPLTGANERAIKPDSLAKAYRTKYNTKRNR